MENDDYYAALSESSSSGDPPTAAADEEPELELGLTLATTTTRHRRSSPPSSVSSSDRQVVVGWPPVRASRMINLFKDEKAKVKREEEEETRKRVGFGSGVGLWLLVKVNMDGDPIGRKVDVGAHQSYKSLAAALEVMFHGPTTAAAQGMKGSSRLLDGSAEFALTYEDKDGDWMLVGDVPWGMFLDTVKRLRIMRTSDANGLGPRCQSSTGGPLRSIV